MSIIIITGMHRSGTSLVAGILRTAGLHIGDELLGPDDFNPRGFFEDKDFVNLQENILESRQLDYLLTENIKIALSDREVSCAKKLISARSSHSYWGWKDPRSTLFLEFWKSQLPDAKFLFVYRHPVEVLFSLLKRAGLAVLGDPLAILKAWEIYNTKVLNFALRHPKRSRLCHIHRILNDREQFSTMVVSELGLPTVPDFDSVYEEGLLKALPIPEWTLQYMKGKYSQLVELYERLERRADMPYSSQVSSNDDVISTTLFLNASTRILFDVHQRLYETATNTHEQPVNAQTRRDIGQNQIEDQHVRHNSLVKEYNKLLQRYRELDQSKALTLARWIGKNSVFLKTATLSYKLIGKVGGFNKQRRQQTGKRAYRFPASVTTSDSEKPDCPKGQSSLEETRPLFNHKYDTLYAHEDPQFSGVVHTFYYEMGGPRSAADYLPGHKLGLPMHRDLHKEEYRYILNKFTTCGIKRLFLHGNWNCTENFLKQIRAEFDSSLIIHAVWHGNTSQFVTKIVRHSFSELLRFKRMGLINEVASVKDGMNILSADIYPEILINMPPNLRRRNQLTFRPSSVVLIPLRNIWRKNFYTNLYAVRNLQNVGMIYTIFPVDTYADVDFLQKIKNLGYLNRDEMFAAISEADVVLNVALSECQPMVFLEALALKVPCLINSVQLGRLDEHPFRKLTCVKHTDSIPHVQKALREVLDMYYNSPQELSEMMEDYENRLCSEAIGGYMKLIDT